MRWTRPGRKSYAAATVLVTGLIVAVLLGDAVAVPAGQTIRAPFSGSTYTSHDASFPGYSSPCNSSVISHHSSWSPTLGAVRWAESADIQTSSACWFTGFNGPATASDNSGVDVSVPIKSTVTAGTHNVTVAFDLKFAASWNISHRACPLPKLNAGSGSSHCQVSAGYDIGYYGSVPALTVAYLYDTKTSNSYWSWVTGSVAGLSNASTFDYFTYCSNYQCTSSNTSTGPTSGSVRFNATYSATFTGVPFGASHRYVLAFQFTGGIQSTIGATSCSSTGRCWSANAQASLNLWRAGEGFFLTSMRIQ
ncbi:MAG TPA: hypothetical protein VGV89_09230 [Thermoplasmata archaeon]|nr:hypothetical protein [Thermoplasmata archaeon]